ncbi:hypothetical protein JTB14_018725 [Gonioctena quinquepunctata]|nr:hypothetical protein JTB14_018725 [Gonioctena quinquepunctata]
MPLDYYSCKFKLALKTESTSPNNEEATNHDSSAGEASNNVTDHFSNHSDYNMVHPGYYVNEVPHPQDVAGQCKTGQIRMIKKRKRRKTSRTQTLAQESTECSDEESDENTKPSDIKILSKIDSTSNIVEFVTRNEETNRKSAIASDSDPKVEHQNFNNAYDRSRNENDNSTFINIKDGRDRESVENKNLSEGINSQVLSNTSKYNLKPDAEEFIPRVHQTPEMPLSPVQFIKIPPNLLTMPVLPFNAQNFNTAFIPPGMPIEFVHTDPKLFSNFISFVSNAVISDDAKKSEIEVDKIIENHDISASNESNTAQDKNDEVVNSGETVNEEITKNMDLNKIVSKLKEAMKKQEKNEVKTDEYSEPTVFTKKIQVDNQLRDNQKYKTNTYKKSFHNNSRNSLEGRAFPKISKYSIRTDSTEIQDVSHGNSQKEIHTENGNIRSSYEHKNYWKSQYEDDATKWQSHVIHRNIELKPQNENIHSVSEVATGTKQNVMGVHSEILESKVWNGKEEDSETNVIKSSSSPSTVAVDLLVLSSKNSSTLSNPKNQWIPVSSRKKRKNKTTEGNDSPFDNVENELSPNDNLFESYDVNLLVDVVPTSKKDIMEIEINDGNAKEIISETEPNSENIQLLSSMKYVTEIENEIIAKKSEKREEAERPNEFKKSKDSLQLENPQKLEDCQQFKKEINFPESLQNELTPEMTMKVNVNKYRNKKKRVIITDIGLSDRCEGVNVQENENVGTVVKVEDKFIVSGKTMKKLTEMSEVEENNAKLLSAVKEHTVNSVKNEKKSSKKKKKKSTNGNSSSSTPAASALNLVDSYDYLLESSSINEPDKTNDDVSQELDRIIQKGIFSSLEGKIKSMNIDESEGFFKSVFSRLSSKEDSVEKAGYLSTPDFTKIPLIKPMTNHQRKMDFF